MQPCSGEMQAMASSLNGTTLQDLQNGNPNAATGQIQNPNPSPNLQIHNDFFDQMLSALPSTWADLDGSNHYASAAAAPYDESTLLASRLRQHQISGGGGGGGGGGSPAAKTPAMFQLSHQQQQMILNSMGRSPAIGAGAEAGLLPLPLILGNGGDVDASSFKSPNSAGGEGLFNGFAGSMQRAANQQHFHHPQAGSMQPQNFGAATPAAALGEGAAAPPRQRVRARRGQATDPHSIAERLRRERIAERMKSLQELVPNANKTDKASMLDEIIDYVKFLQLQVKVLSMSRLGGAAAVAPLVADISSEGRGRGNNGSAPASDSLTVTEHQVAKLMEEDMGSAMQYLQGKGLCLMPISLASAISTATCHPRVNNPGLVPHPNGGDSPSSPNLSVLTVQSAVGAGADGERSSVKDATSVSKPEVSYRG